MSKITADAIGLSREEFKILHAALHDPERPLSSAMTSSGARTVIYGLRSAIEEVIAGRMNVASAAAWDERDTARPQYLGPNDGHYEDCMGWEDCDCASYPNPYRPT